MKKIKNFILSLQFIFIPSYWQMNERYSKDWDKELNKLLDNNKFILVNNYSAKLGDKIIWVANQPYSTMVPYSSSHTFRASRLTIKRAIKQFNKDLIL